MLAALLVSAGTLGNGLVFDDHLLMGGNAPVIRGEQPLSSAFTYRYWGVADEASPNELYRPVAIASLALNARVLGDGPVSLHAVNILLHSLNALMVYLLIRKLFDRPILALIAALIFAVHPIATEAVAAVAGRADLLATFFLLAASLLGLVACRRRGKWILAGGLGLALVTFMGALSKESVFAAPLVTAAVLGSDARRHHGNRDAYRHYLITAGTLACIQVFVLLMVMVLRFGILGYVYRSEPPSSPSTAYLAFVNNPIQFAEPLGRVLTALRVAVMGAGLLIFPLRLSADYSYNALPVTSGVPGAADIAAVVFLALYLGVLFFSARRFPVAMFALSWSALTYLIVSNLLFPIGTIFGERLLYLPSIGFALLLAAGLTRLGGRAPLWRGTAAALTALLLILYGARFTARCRDWVDDEHLFQAAVAVNPGSAKAHSNYAATLQFAGRYDAAIEHYGVALRIAPGLTGSGISLARILTLQGRPDEAVRQYQKVIERDDGISVAWSGLGLAHEAAGNDSAAESAFRKALSLSLGRNQEAILGLARVMQRTSREEQSVDLLERMAKANPGAPEVREELAQAHYRLGVLRLGQERPEEFLSEMGRAVELDPRHGPAHYNLAVAALERGDTAQARDHARAALLAGYELPPGFLEACGIQATPPP
ncbi:MAG TPA: tetratricopeptide repeat protein [Candidatus Polarisedimenticolia bacterium]